MKYLFSCLLLIISFSLSSQSYCDCSRNVEVFNKTVQNLPVTRNTSDLSAYNKALSAANNYSYSGNYPEYDCFQQMSKILVTLNDRHNMMYSEVGFDVNQSDTTYQEFPEFEGDLDSLKTKLELKPLEDVEGIYSRDGFSIGVYKSEENLTLVNLSGGEEVWQKGEIIGRFLKYGNGRYLAAIGQFHDKQLVNFPLEIKNGHISKLQLSKSNASPDLSSIEDTETYQYSKSGDITYMRIGSFSGYNPVLKNAENFYKSLEEKPVTKDLILDLRDNGGGGDRNSDILYKYLRKNYKNARLYVLINGNTVSNAEQFALRLQKFKNVTLLGSKTSGTIAYELGKTYDFPCYNFKGFFTFKGDKKYLEYESVGVQPEISLDNSEDWIKQTKEYIAKSK
ncbi:peptidase S41-like protein [Gramella sp. Hel_I_59]|uniref:S41 family peptidase n=1 Tax=Gramella sp. Hel_I_59 TaxID=1249978 RepID=UPI001152FC06|nr:S41 family peptidase [Gramella sp. Hel_I_59]TQI71908.1 peptidase S41-like protein [Gramella sp. Hel_I_59]